MIIKQVVPVREKNYLIYRLNIIIMSSKKIKFLIVFAFLLCIKTNGQGPPPVAMPSKDNTALIDKIIEVTKHKKYFTDYCTEKVKEYAEENKWNKAKTKKILSSINFEDYNSTIYNSYAFYSETQLKNLLTVMADLAKTKHSSPFILTNDMMQSNLENYLKGVIEEKYVL